MRRSLCNAWIEEVESAGFVPGVYIGARAILTGEEIFWRLRAKHFWKSGSRVPEIPHRGYQLIQKIIRASGNVVTNSNRENSRLAFRRRTVLIPLRVSLGFL